MGSLGHSRRSAGGLPHLDTSSEHSRGPGISDEGLMRVLVGLAGRAVFWVGLLFILGHAARSSYFEGNIGMLVAKVVFFPITYVIYPWLSGLWWVLLASLVGYWLSTFVGNLPPVD